MRRFKCEDKKAGKVYTARLIDLSKGDFRMQRGNVEDIPQEEPASEPASEPPSDTVRCGEGRPGRRQRGHCTPAWAVLAPRRRGTSQEVGSGARRAARGTIWWQEAPQQQAAEVMRHRIAMRLRMYSDQF